MNTSCIYRTPGLSGIYPHRHPVIRTSALASIRARTPLRVSCQSKYSKNPKKKNLSTPPIWGAKSQIPSESKSLSDVSDLSSGSFDNLSSGEYDGPGSVSSSPQWWKVLNRKLNDLVETLMYQYYNWREDTFSDLTIFILISTVAFIAFGKVLPNVVALDRSLSGEPGIFATDPVSEYWMDLYRVLKVVLGAELPETDESGLIFQAFAVMVSVFGLASFALVLALIEQVVLEVLETNVEKGSPVREKGHTLILAWGESARDLSQIARLLQELSAANRAQGGGTIVVIAQEREKLELEAIYSEAVPMEERFGSKFVFRRGSPLDPAALHLAAAADARAIIIGGDCSRSNIESDAQVLRTAVLLDEMIIEKHGLANADSKDAPIVIAEVCNNDNVNLLRYSCSSRVIPVPTTRINVQRYARLIKQPILAVFTQMLTDHTSVAHGRTGAYPKLSGQKFGDLHFMFPEAIILGITSEETGRCELNPAPDTEIGPTDRIVMIAPGWLGDNVKPLSKPVSVDVGDWSPELYKTWSVATASQSSIDEDGAGDAASSSNSDLPMTSSTLPILMNSVAISARPSEHLESCYRRVVPPGQLSYLVPAPIRTGASSTYLPNAGIISNKPMHILLCGMPGTDFVTQLLNELDTGIYALPPGSSVTLVNEHDWSATICTVCGDVLLQNIKLMNIRADPRCRDALLNALDMKRYDAAVVMHDKKWVEETNGLRNNDDTYGYRLSQADCLRLDAAVLMVQLNMRHLLEEANESRITIITEKLTYIGISRFEDNTRLPLGNSVNSASYAAKVLAQVACEPTSLRPYLQLGIDAEDIVQDSSAFAREGEELSFLQLQARVSSCGMILSGYYRLPENESYGDTLEIVFNPQGLEERERPVVWNKGDGKCKLVTMVKKNKVENIDNMIDNMPNLVG